MLTIAELIEANEHSVQEGSAHARLGAYVREHLDEVALDTARDISVRVGVSGSAAVRFAQHLGFDGWPGLRKAAQNEYRMQHGGTVYVHDSPPAPEGGMRVVVERAVQDDAMLAALSDMLASRDPETIPGRRALRIAITNLANATGRRETSRALRALAVEALAWDRMLGSGRATQEAEAA